MIEPTPQQMERLKEIAKPFTELQQLESSLKLAVEALQDYVSRCLNCGGSGSYQDESGQCQCQWCDSGLITLSTIRANHPNLIT